MKSRGNNLFSRILKSVINGMHLDEKGIFHKLKYPYLPYSIAF